MRLFPKIQLIAILSASIGIFTSCTGKKSTDTEPTASDIPCSKVEIDLSPEYYDYVTGNKTTDIVVLKEDENTMFVEPDRILDANGKYYLLDSYSGSTVVAFTHDGKPYAHYGRVGQGPGEYNIPRDIDVTEDNIYILGDKKIIKYSDDGEYIDEITFPFFAEAFKMLSDGRILLNLGSNGEISPSLVITDSSAKEFTTLISYPDGYVGGWSTNDVFRKAGDEISFYLSPDDNMWLFDSNGNFTQAITFDFKQRSFPSEIKLDFLKRDRTSHEFLWFDNSPIRMNNGAWIGLVEDGGTQYTVIFSDADRRCGVRPFDKNSSVYDIIEPMCADLDDNIISYLDSEIAARCRDYDSLDPKVRAALEDGDRALVIHKFDNN